MSLLELHTVRWRRRLRWQWLRRSKGQPQLWWAGGQRPCCRQRRRRRHAAQRRGRAERRPHRHPTRRRRRRCRRAARVLASHGHAGARRGRRPRRSPCRCRRDGVPPSLLCVWLARGRRRWGGGGVGARHERRRCRHASVPGAVRLPQHWPPLIASPSAPSIHSPLSPLSTLPAQLLPLARPSRGKWFLPRWRCSRPPPGPPPPRQRQRPRRPPLSPGCGRSPRRRSLSRPANGRGRPRAPYPRRRPVADRAAVPGERRHWADLVRDGAGAAAGLD